MQLVLDQPHFEPVAVLGWGRGGGQKSQFLSPQKRCHFAKLCVAVT